jgi:Lrp/AsnC family leucine-responsive transcriptional regulator
MRVQKASTRVLDRIDHAILAILQGDGRIVMKDLAERVGLSLTPCIERVKRMERDGVITGYHAHVSPQAIGLQILVFVEITLQQKSEDAFDAFRHAIAALPQVLECHLVSGDFDYLIKARIPEMAEYRRLLGEILGAAGGGGRAPGAAQSRSYVVMEEIKETLALAIAP